MKSALRICRLLPVIAICLVASVPAGAQSGAYPSRPITLVVPNAPGGNYDIVARTLGTRLAELFRQPVVVDNRVGAASNLGSAYVAHADPDGYTLMVAGQELTVNEYLYKLSFDAKKSFVPITLMTDSPIYMVARKDLPVKTVADVIALAKAKPNGLTYASSGIGSPPHLAAELFKSLSGVEIMHVPYKGGAQSITDVIGGRIDLQFPSKTLAKPHVDAGTIKLLASTGEKRLTAEPGLPTVAETVPGYAIHFWAGMFAPAGTPKPVIDVIYQATRTALAEKEVAGHLQKMGITVINSDASELESLMQSERVKYSALVKGGRITALQ